MQSGLIDKGIVPESEYVSRLLLQLIQVFQSRENDLLACLLNLACEKDFVQDSIDL
jgi:hypothetical protein